ncbi:MAG: type IV toxin-antitoxin system AbiEi family antitoxin [Candidatus Rokuibacteriota bacterium]
MNPAGLTDRELETLKHAIAGVRRTTGLVVELVTREPRLVRAPRPDAVLEIQEGGKRFQFFAEVKTIDRTVALTAAKHQLEPYGRKGVLVAPYLTTALARHCRERLDLQFIDTAGNTYLRVPGLYVFVQGEKRPEPAMPGADGPARGGTATALRAAFVLLCRPELFNAPYREIARAAGIGLGTVGWAFFDLERRGHLAAARQRRNRRLLEPTRLLDEWITNFPIRLRPKLNPRRFRAPDPGWWAEAHLPAGARWGGEVAAARLTNHLKPATATIYLEPATAREALAALVQEHRLRADPQGNVEVLDAFWTLPTQEGAPPDLVPPVLVYADLMATLDPRNLEVAKRIREQHIEHALRRV